MLSFLCAEKAVGAEQKSAFHENCQERLTSTRDEWGSRKVKKMQKVHRRAKKKRHFQPTVCLRQWEWDKACVTRLSFSFLFWLSRMPHDVTWHTSSQACWPVNTPTALVQREDWGSHLVASQYPRLMLYANQLTLRASRLKTTSCSLRPGPPSAQPSVKDS